MRTVYLSKELLAEAEKYHVDVEKATCLYLLKKIQGKAS